MRKDTRRFVAVVMVLIMLFSMVGGVRSDVHAEESTSYTSEVDVTLYVGQFATCEQSTSSAYQASDDIDSSIATAEFTYETIVYDAQLGTDSSYKGDYTNLENALYTFTGSTDAGWVISNTTSDGTTVYVNIDNSSNGYPNNTTSDTLTLTYYSDGFTITNGDGRNLAFLNSSYNSAYTFDEGNSGKESTGVYQFYIYRQVVDNEDSSEELPGYVKVTSLDGITSGSQYLIVACRDSSYYVLYPSTSTSDKYAHVAKALGSTLSYTDYSVTFTGVSAGTTSMVVGDVKYNITVLAATATGSVSLEGGASTALNISDLVNDYSLSEGCTVVWSVDDSDIAGIYSTDGASVSLIAHAQGTTNVIAKVYDSSGNVVEVYVWTITVTSTYGSGNYTYTWTVTETVYNGTLYYSVDGGELIEAELKSTSTDQYGNTIRHYTISYTSENVSLTGLLYFIKPDEGYVVTYVYDEKGDTYSQFYSYDTKNYSITKPDGHSGGWPTDIMTNAELTALLAQAAAAGCEALYWNTRNGGGTGITADGSYIGNYTNYCSKLPTVEKSITSLSRKVNGVETTITYVDGETEVKVGDVINYTVTITNYWEKVNVTYSNAILKDTMSSGSNGTATFLESSLSGTNATSKDETYTTLNVTGDLGNDATQTDATATVSYTVTYTVTENDVDSQLLNTVSLEYDYSTEYYSGSYGGSASAVAAVNLSSFDPDDIVIDFGLPVTIDYSGDRPESGNSSIKEGSANYGTVEVTNGNKVTYTPTSVLTEVDTVTLYSVGGASTTFKVYPATTVYYEEGFATYGSGWSIDTTSKNGWNYATETDAVQEAQIATATATDAGKTYNNYGLDDSYAGDTSGSNGTAATTINAGDTLSFTFVGTGVDIFANCDSGSGMVAIQVVNNDNSTTTVEKFLFVDMANAGTYTSGTSYNTPIASVSDLTYGSHTVTIYLVSASTSGFRFDGFRVYDTIEQKTTDDSSEAYTIQSKVYAATDEDNPDYYELRNSVLAALAVATETSAYKDDLEDGLAQVYETSETSAGAVVVYTASSNGIVKTSSDAQKLLDDGPKNELYLYPGATVVFKITTKREVQVGMRSVTGESVTYSVSATDDTASLSPVSIAGTKSNATMSSSVDMFYDLVAKGTEKTYIITITNSADSAGILSITDIKISDCNEETIFEELTAEEIVAALENINASTEAWSVSAALSEAAAEAAEQISQAAYTVKELVFNRTYTGDITFSAAEFTGNKVLLLQPSSDDPNTYELAGESMVDADGNVTFSIAESTNGILVSGTSGDVNGDGAVNASDTLAILRGVSGRTTLTAVLSGFADVNYDGTVNSNDLLAVVKYVSGRTGTLY